MAAAWKKGGLAEKQRRRKKYLNVLLAFESIHDSV
jgi:hypothetical protein